MRYRRDRTGGGCYFFTVVTHRRRPFLTRPEAIDALRAALREVRAGHPFSIDAFVVLPDHLHAIWTLGDGDEAYSRRWSLIKAGFSRRYHPADEPRPTASRRAKGERALWQRRFWEHRIRDDADYANHIDYIHFNPVKHGLVTAVRDWPHSTFHRYVRDGVLPADWAGDVGDIDTAGE